MRIRMRKTVRPDLPLGIILLGKKPGTILRAGMEYQAMTNKNGAISGLCDNGEYLGVKLGEFEFVEAPEWVLKIHGAAGKNRKIMCTKRGVMKHEDFQFNYSNSKNGY